MEFETREDEQEHEWDCRRARPARLLPARGHRHAAAIVQVSGYRTDCVSNNTSTVTLSVPPELYDHARRVP